MFENEIVSSNTEEVADLPEQEESNDVEVDTEEVTEQAQQQEAADPVPEKPKQDHETNKAFQEMRKKLQDTEREKEEIKKQAEALQRAARVTGFNSVDEYLQAVEQAEKEVEAKMYQEAANDPERLKELIANDPTIIQAKEILFQNEIIKQKESLKDKRFFSILEPDIEQIVRENKSIDMQTAYKYLVGERIDELLEKEKEHVKKSTIADIADKSKRSAGNITGDASGSDDLDVDSVDKHMAAAFGNDPKDVAKYKKKLMR